MRLYLGSVMLFALFVTSCKSHSENNNTVQNQNNETPNLTNNIIDPHSYAKTQSCVVKHLDLTLDINFRQKILTGLATWTIEKAADANEIIFDTKNLNIKKIWLDDYENTEYQLGTKDPILGSSLAISIKPNTKTVSIEYQTTPDAEALMWLEPEQTQGKIYPFLFTQSEAILARTWLPCQDGPAVRYTYNATVTTPKGLMAAMSAENPKEKNAENTYHFQMKQPIPSYLMALVCGNLTFREIGNRTGVYAEPELIDAAEYELGEMQTMLEKAEKLYGPYVWGRYDVVFLPPSFPFGGMENPRLTFATPTIIAGDRSLTALIAHEMAHSWSGNLVTNATWDDFWLNEGFTVYFEQRIMEEIYGREYSEMLALLSYEDLLDELEDFEKDSMMNDTHLKLDLKGRNPDDGMSSIAYDKGYLFLRMLEENFGRETFDLFLKTYFSENAFKAMTTEKFVEYLQSHLLSTNAGIAENCQIDSWIYGSGLPNNCPQIKSAKLAAVNALINGYFLEANMDIAQINSSNWTAQEYIYFVANMPNNISKETLAIVDNHFHFTESTNSEILGKWFQFVARSQYQNGYASMENFLINVGRRKFLTPIYRELCKTNEGWLLASDIYNKARLNYHAVARNTIEALLNETNAKEPKTNLYN